MTRGGAAERLTRPPGDIDLERPSVARVYDYYLGGSHNYAVDREMARRIMAVLPDVPRAARANRHFLRRAVEYLVGAGVRQFLDIGSGIPTAGNVHEIVLRLAPDARVTYVDVDAIAVAHSRALLAGREQVAVVQADLRDPDRVLSDPDLRRVLDLDRPVAVLLVSVLHFVADADEPAAVLGRYREAVCTGSYLALSHITRPAQPLAGGTETLELYQRGGTPVTPRSESEVRRLFDGFDLVEPGLVAVSRWRPEAGAEDAGTPDPALDSFLAGVGRKP